jgi:hypothetical protein
VNPVTQNATANATANANFERENVTTNCDVWQGEGEKRRKNIVVAGKMRKKWTLMLLPRAAECDCVRGHV